MQSVTFFEFILLDYLMQKTAFFQLSYPNNIILLMRKVTRRYSYLLLFYAKTSERINMTIYSNVVYISE